MGVFHFLVRFLREFVRWFPESPIPSASAFERLARFLTAKKHFDRTRNIITPLAFLLRGDQQGLSVFQIDGLGESQIRELARHIKVNRIFGYGEITREDVRSVGLRFHRDDRPLRHGNLVHWPAAKEEQMSIAQQLAALAVPSFY